ncbi:hypothetical protein SJAG_00994 [Schizosaccharomyces japonicus yFS275]|uniref:Uncharacterized protein n=1 Tax=Schizosaccharomyces japonicus (strain yFS275 / FY16936) TaxID=402676 RepID=B6JX66_SCHJY|nr:hypothetical protein SJAG_00994 [Schizosaccharomyces japonicus yFS275]EEB05967.2 hypothetical protein SJAG_00994 [Schizosaccharomyces japonicus yFS275]
MRYVGRQRQRREKHSMQEKTNHWKAYAETAVPRVQETVCREILRNADSVENAQWMQVRCCRWTEPSLRQALNDGCVDDDNNDELVQRIHTPCASGSM